MAQEYFEKNCGEHMSGSMWEWLSSNHYGPEYSVQMEARGENLTLLVMPPQLVGGGFASTEGEQVSTVTCASSQPSPYNNYMDKTQPPPYNSQTDTKTEMNLESTNHCDPTLLTSPAPTVSPSVLAPVYGPVCGPVYPPSTPDYEPATEGDLRHPNTPLSLVTHPGSEDNWVDRTDEKLEDQVITSMMAEEKLKVLKEITKAIDKCHAVIKVIREDGRKQAQECTDIVVGLELIGTEIAAKIADAQQTIGNKGEAIQENTSNSVTELCKALGDLIIARQELLLC